MEWISLYNILLLLLSPHVTQCSVATTKTSTHFKKRPGLIWDNCLVPLQAKSLLECITHCLEISGGGSSCLGFNFQTNAGPPHACSLCVAKTTTSISNASLPSPTHNLSVPALYFRYDTVVLASSFVPADCRLHLPDGLRGGQVFVFRIYPVHGQAFTIGFIDSGQDGANIDFLFQAFFSHPDRYNTLVLSAYDKTTNNWGPEERYPLLAYLRFGEDIDAFVIVQVASFTVYVNGKLLSVYPRSQRLALKDVKYLSYPCFNIPSTYTLMSA